MQEMTAYRILERVSTHRKFVLINNYSSLCFLYLWLSLLIQHRLHFPATTRRWFQVFSIPLFSLNSQFLSLENFSSPFILSASFPSPSDILPSTPLWLGFLWVKALCVAWRQTGFLLWVPVQKCQESWWHRQCLQCSPCCAHAHLPSEQYVFHPHAHLVHVYAAVKLSAAFCFLLFIRPSKWWNWKKKYPSVNP